MTKQTGRRLNGEGSIYYERDRKRWRGQVMVNGRLHKVRGTDKTEVSAKMRALISAADAGTLALDRRVTVADAIERFTSRSMPARRGGTLSPSTRETHQWAARTIVEDIGTKRLATLTPRMVEDFFDRCARTRRVSIVTDGVKRTVQRPALSRSSLVKVRSTLRMAIADAVKRGEVPTNVATLADLPGDLPPASARTALSPANSRRLLAHLPNERNGAMYALCLCLGLRPGEAAGLHWSSIKDDRVTISRAVRLERGNATVVDALKTSTSNRTLKMPPNVVALLAAHRKAQAAERLASASWTDERLVFATTAGTVLSPANVRRHLTDVCNRAGVPAIRPNELRHSCASYLSDLGIRHEDIADLLGHTTTRMVDKTYRHRLRSSVEVAAGIDWTDSMSS